MIFFSWLHPVPWTVALGDLPDRYDWSPPTSTKCAQCGEDTGSDAMLWCSEKCQVNWRAQNRNGGSTNSTEDPWNRWTSSGLHCWP